MNVPLTQTTVTNKTQSVPITRDHLRVPVMRGTAVMVSRVMVCIKDCSIAFLIYQLPVMYIF